MTWLSKAACARCEEKLGSSAMTARDVPRFVSLYQQGLLPVDRLMSEKITLDEINVGFDRLADGASVRQILLP